MHFRCKDLACTEDLVHHYEALKQLTDKLARDNDRFRSYAPHALAVARAYDSIEKNKKVSFL